MGADMSKNSRLAKAEAKAAKAQAKALRPPMYRRKSFWIISAVVVVIVIAGTSNNEDTSEGTSADVAVTTTSTSTDIPDPRAEYFMALVSERYADCFRDLGGETDVAYSVDNQASREYVVVVTISDGRALRFDVGTAPGGADLTMPKDRATGDILDSVDC
jgi:hypothetical protein